MLIFFVLQIVANAPQAAAGWVLLDFVFAIRFHVQ
jgi:hypothetical protein